MLSPEVGIVIIAAIENMKDVCCAHKEHYEYANPTGAVY